MRSKYGLIVVWVVAISSIFIGAFLLKFGDWPTSDDTSNWADFATYLSGTVGVTAVLGTLFAVVKTLGQQQALIDSQSDMLEKQEQQLALAKLQQDSEKERRNIELAYNSSLKIFPILIDKLKIDLEEQLYSGGQRENEIFESIKESGARKIYRRNEMISEVEEMLDVLLEVDGASLYAFSERMFFSIDKIYLFMVNKIEIEEDLRDYF